MRRRILNNTKIFSITKRLRWKLYIALFVVSIEFKNPNISYIFEKALVFSVN